MQRRPTSVTVFAIIDIILAVLGVLGMTWYLVVQLGLIPQINDANNPAMQIMEDNAAYRLFTQVGSAVGFVATIALLCGAVGLLQLRPWARTTVIVWSVYVIIATTIATVLNHVLLMMPLLEQAQGPEKIGIQIGMSVAIVFSVIYIVFAALQIFMLTRPKVVAVFANPQDHEII